MALALAALFGAGGFLTALSVVLPHPGSVNETGALVNAVIALVTSLVLVRWGARFPVVAFQVLVLVGSVLIALGIHFGGYAVGTPSYALFYLWVAVYSFSFFSILHSLAQAAFSATAHLAVLLVDDSAGLLINDWVLTWGILLVTGLVVGWLSGQVRTLAETDTLTGLRNRRAWEGELSRELANASRTGRPTSVVVIDIDGLKSVNDREGHQAGDRLLKEAAAAWSGAIRSGDLIARLGGDEFAILLTSCTLAGAEVSVERLRSTCPVAFSAGCALWDGSETPDELMHRADVALYEQKGPDRRTLSGPRAGSQPR